MSNNWFSPTICTRKELLLLPIKEYKCSKMKTYIFLLILEEPCSKFNYLLQTNEYIRKALAVRRETEAMLSDCLNQKISWSNEEKKRI